MSIPGLLSVRLHAGYGKATVLKEVAFDLSSGEALGLIGTSGAGKSTLVLALLGLLHGVGALPLARCYSRVRICSRCGRTKPAGCAAGALLSYRRAP